MGVEGAPRVPAGGDVSLHGEGAQRRQGLKEGAGFGTCQV